MALSGVHVGCAPVVQQSGASLPGPLDWSRTMVSATTTDVAVPGQSGNRQLEVAASLDIFFAIGPNPDAVNGPRRFLKGDGYTSSYPANPGDKLAWIAA